MYETVVALREREREGGRERGREGESEGRSEGRQRQKLINRPSKFASTASS